MSCNEVESYIFIYYYFPLVCSGFDVCYGIMRT